MAGKRKKLTIDDPTLWYLVGVITSDGCLSSDGRHISITAKEFDYLDLLKSKAGFTCKVGTKHNGRGERAYHLQIGNVGFYEFLVAQGLSPKKSLIQKAVNVPQEYFSDFCRGIIDGDGNIRRWTHPTNSGEQWVLRIYSGSKDFIDWLQESIKDIFGATGCVHVQQQIGKNAAYILKYGKMAAIKILKHCYYENAVALERKARLAQECYSSRRGWKKSKTVLLN